MRIVRRFESAVLAAALLAFVAVSSALAVERPKLVVFITIDQLRGDMPWLHSKHFGEGGFKYLMEKGVAYRQAHYRHSTTFTAVGHASLATGGNAFHHGLAGNDWHDRKTNKQMYCVEDDRHPLIGQEVKAHQGTSPRNLTATTFGDELVMATNGRSRVFSVSGKDRGAILPGGHLGKAFWYSSSSGKFVTSTYYYDAYPEWVTAWNNAKHADAYKDQEWTLLHDRSTYLFADNDDQPWEKSYKHLGGTFPHKIGSENEKDYYGGLRFTPHFDELTVGFAKELMKQEKVGLGEYTDMLAVSLSATDYIGHAFGPDSLEAEDNIRRLDRTLADFFKFIDEHVGLDNTLIALSSDHGTPSVPEMISHMGLAAGRHRPENFVAAVNEGLKKRFNTEENLVLVFWNPSLYLDLEAVERAKLTVPEVEYALVEEILKVPGVTYAATRTELLKGNVTADPMLKKLQLSFHPTRSGNVLFIQDLHWYLYPKPDEFAAMHGSPYAYDTYVPIMFAGPRIKPQVVHRVVAPEDIASTITAYLGVKPPSGSTGTPLIEMLQQ